MSQESRHGYEAQIYLSGNRPDAGSAIRGSYTDPALSYTGYPTMPSINARSPVYQAPNPHYSARPLGRDDQEDGPPNPYERRQYNQEKPKIGVSAGRHDQTSRHEPRPSSRSRTSRTESSTKKSALGSGRGPRRRAPSTYTDDDVDEDDEEEEDEKVLFFIPSRDINIEVLAFYLKQFLGHDSDTELGRHPRVSISAMTSDPY